MSLENPLDNRAQRIKELVIKTIKAIKPEEAPDDAAIAEIDPQLDLAAKALVEAFDILNS